MWSNIEITNANLLILCCVSLHKCCRDENFHAKSSENKLHEDIKLPQQSDKIEKYHSATRVYVQTGIGSGYSSGKSIKHKFSPFEVHCLFPSCCSGSTAANMVRKLKHHEQKLLRKVDFTTCKSLLDGPVTYL